MTFKVDENFPVELAEDLRGLGHGCDTVVGEGLCGAPDPVVVEAARVGGRVLLTLDKGIADIVRYPVHGHAGMVLFRPDSAGRRAVLLFVRARLSELLEMPPAGQLTIVGPSRIRVR